MSKPSYDQATQRDLTGPSEKRMDQTTSSSGDHAFDYNHLGLNSTLTMDPMYANDADLFSSHAMDVFESVTDSSSYDRPSPTSNQETNYFDLGEFPGLSQDFLPVPLPNFQFKDDNCGAISAEDDDEEYCAELAERWVEEQINKEDSGCLKPASTNNCDGNIEAASTERTSSAMPTAAQGPCENSAAVSSSFNPITPVHRCITLSKSQAKRASKRSASEVSSSSSTQKPVKRRNAKNLTQGIKSESRIKMDNALHERSEAQMALREALVNLKKARILERECRARYASATHLVNTTAEKECEALLREETPWNSMFHQLKKYKDETGGCIIKQEEDNKSPEMARLAAWMCKNRKGCKLKVKSSNTNKASSTPTPIASPDSKADIRPDCSASNIHNRQAGTIALEEHDDSSVFEDVDPDSILADPYKKLALDSIGFDYDPRSSRWNQMYQELKAFKEIHGNTLVPRANVGLGGWVKRQQVQYSLYSSGSKSELTEERVCLLNDLGFVWNRRKNNWHENFLRLKRWTEEHGSCHIPDGTDDPDLVALSKWVAEQRAAYKRNTTEDGPCEGDTNTENATKKKKVKLCPQKIQALESIGFEFDSRDAKWLQKLDGLLEYKKHHGNFMVPSHYGEDPTLSNWVAAQRQQYKLYQKGSKSHMTKRRLKILTECGFDFSTNRKEEMQKKKDEEYQQEIDEFDTKPWIEKYKDLLLHLDEHGSFDSLQKSNALLCDWVEKQRQSLFSAEDGSKQPDDPITSSSEPIIDDTGASSIGTFENQRDVVADRERVALMKVAESFASSRAAELSAELGQASAAIESWDTLFGSLAAWYIKVGTYCTKSMPAKLKKFMSKVQEQHRLLHAGTETELTQDRIDKLNDICFPFEHVSSNESSDNDAAALRRNKSWEEYRLDLAISYVHKGNYDLQAIDDVELRRWAAEQKRQHKLYLAGKQSSLSFTQIQRLIDIKFISKRCKQWSWPELCGDLMAFRIQFGTYNVASATVVNSTSKGKPSCHGTTSTTLSNIKDFITRLKASKDELTQAQLQKLTRARFPWDEPATTEANVSLEQKKPITKHIFGAVLEVCTIPMQ